jgi:hypothetical protein
MATNYHDYFISRISGDDPLAGNAKFADLQQASADKIAELGKIKEAQLVREKTNAGSLVGQWGLDADSLAGRTTNMAANLNQGVFRIAGNVLSAPFTGVAAADQATLSEDDIVALERHQKGQSTPEDLVRINRKVAPIVAPTPGMPRELAQAHANERAQAMADSNPNAPTPLSMWAEMNKARDISRTIVESADKSRLVQQDAQSAFTSDLTNTYTDNAPQIAKGWEDLKNGSKLGGSADIALGVAKLLFGGISDVASNPQATLEHIVQNAPQLLMGLAGKAGATAQVVDNVAYAADTYNKGIQDYQANNGGALPSESQRQYMAFMAATHAAAEQVGDKIGLAATKLVGSAAQDVSRVGFKAALKGTAAGVGQGVLTEAPTETYQQFAEGEMLGKPATGAELFAAGVIGGASGAGLSGGGRAVHEVAKLAATPSGPKQETVDRAKVQDAAIASGDVSKVTDPVEQISALFGHSQKADTTQEQKQTNLAKASEIVAALETQHEAVQQEAKTSTVAGVKELIAERQAQLADPETAKDPAKVALLNKSIELAQADLTDLEASNNQKAVETAVQKKLDGVTQQLKDANLAKDNLAVLVQAKDTVEADIALISTPAPKEETGTLAADFAAPAKSAVGASYVEQQTAAVERVITLAMTAPERLDAKVLATLAADTNNALTAPQRAYLSAFVRAREADPTLRMSHVAADIYEGKHGNKGVVQYRTAMGKAIASGNQKAAKAEVTGITSFALAQQAKAAAAGAALKLGLGTSILKEGGNWVVGKPGVAPTAEQRAEGGRPITSGRLAINIKNEAAALDAIAAEIQTAYDLKFNTGAEHVQNTSQQGPGSPAEVKGTPKQVTKPAGDSIAVESVGATDGKPTAVVGASIVEADGVKPTELTEKTVNTEETPVSSVNTEITQSTEKTGETTEEVKSTTELTPSETTQPDGTLSAMTMKSPEGTPFNLRNLIADFFTQTAGKDSDTTQRPLVAIKDFLSQMSSKTVLESLSFTELTDNQFNVLKTFKSAAMSWSKTIQSNLSMKKNAAFRYDDMTQFFLIDTENGPVLEENVQTAMSYAAFSWIAENASRSRFNTPEEINLILGRDEDHAVSKAEQAALGHVGTRQNVVANALGQRAVQALGLKANKNAPKDLMPRLESALGAHIFKMLMDQGILERVTVPGSVMAQLTGKTQTDTGASFQFLRIATNSDGKLNSGATKIMEATRGTQGILDKVFSVEAGLKEPSLAPIPFEQTKTKNTQQGVPAKLAAVMEHENSVPSYVRQDMWQLVNQIADETMLEIAGAEHLEGKHIANIPSLEATNDGLARELDRFKAFVGGMADQAAGMFFEHTVWKQQRVGIATNAVNPQTSKIHRHMLFRQSWETKIDRNDAAQMENFQLRVAEGLGVKTDKQSNTSSLEKYSQKVADPEIQAAVTVLVQMLQGEDMSPAKEKALLAGVKAGGEKMHSLDALMALAKEQYTKGDTFTTHLMGEVDGVTNGPMLSHLLMGAANSVADLFKLLNRGGFYEQGNEHSQYNLWREAAGHFDLYENTALHMTQAVQAFVNNGVDLGKGRGMSGAQVNAIIQSIYAFTGPLELKGVVQKEGRNIIKTPLTAMVFGSSVGSAVESMANKFVESIYAGIEDLAAGKGDRVEMIGHINTLLGSSIISSNDSIEQLMKMEFTTEQLDRMKRSFKNTVGKAVAETMQQDFDSFISQRQQFNHAAQITFELYNAAYTALRDQKIKELIESGEIAVTGKGDPIHDLTAQQENQLRKQLADLTPVMHTMMSKDSGQLNAGLYISKSGKSLSTKTTYEGSIKFGTKFSDNGAASTSTRGFETVETAPGVSMAPMSVHSTDSAIMHNSIGKTDVLNVHDAKGVGVAGFQEAAQSLNQSTWNAMLNYSPASEMFAALSRTVIGLAALTEKGDLPPAVMENVAKALQAFADKHDMDSATVLSQMVQYTFAMATHANSIKLQALGQMQAIDQYALQGGNYKVTEKDRAEAAARRAELPTALSKEEAEAVSKLESLLKVQATEKPIKQEKDIEEDVSTPASPFGVLGQSTKSDPALVKFFKENPKATAKQTIKFLYDKLTADTGAVNRDFNLKLLKVLLKTVPAGLTVNLVTKDTQESDVAGKPDEPALGWYTHRGAEEVIYIVGNDFTHSNMQVEVLLHEMTHAATSYRLFATAGKVQAAELSTLLDQVRKYTKANGITKFDAALVNVDELVAYGMTSPAFQKLLSQVEIAPVANSALTTALQKFVNTLANLLGFKDTASAKALGVLITNVSALMEQGANEKTGLEGRTLSMAAPTNTYSTIDIHDALADGSLTTEFDEHLRSLLGGIVYNLHGAFGSFKETLMKNQTMSAIDVWLKAESTGVAPFASEALGHIATTPQVAYALEQVEATVRAALGTNESQTKMVYRELYNLYGEAETLVTVQALIDAGLDAATAKATHDMLFKLDKTSGDRSNYLARFAALGLAHPVINQVLQAATAKESRKARDAKTFMERLEIVFENIMKMFRTYVTHTYQGQPANDKLLSLVSQLVDIEAKYQRKIAAKANTSNFLEPVEAKLKVFVEATGAKIEAIAGSNFVRNNKYTAVKLAGGLVGTVAGGRADLFMDGLFRLRAETFKKRFGVVASLAQAYVGQNVVFQGLLRMTKLLEHDRQKQVEGWAKTAIEAYADNGKGLRGKAKDSVAARASITAVFMRTGAHNLMGDFDMAGIEQLVTDKAALDTAISSFENQLAVHGKATPYYVNQANALGYKLATGIARTKFVNQNAHAIARLSGTGQESKVSATQAEQAEATLKVLVTLYALRYSDATAVGHAARVIKEENARADKMNGLEMTLLLQKRLETESLERLFGNNPMLMVHGYTSEIYDPNVSSKTANVLEGKALLEQGYVKRSEVPRDPADDDQDVKHLYVLQDGGVPRFVSGAISNKGMKAKGTTIHNGFLNSYNATGIANASQNAALMQDRQADIADMFRPGPVKDLSKEKGSYLVPVFNESGTVVNWRYMMAETTKDNVLNRNNRFDKVLGTIAGSIYDKETSREQNMTSVKALYDQYQTDYKSNPKSYIDIGPKSTDPEMREIWNLLPDDTRKDIKSVWGHNGMTVKVENLDIMFGYHKLSVGTVFQKANEERDARKLAGQRTEVMALKTIDAWQKLVVMLFEFPLVGTGLKQGMTMEEAKKYARKAGANAVRTEHIWQALVSEAKDIIVVKSGVVLLGNMSSNIWLLGMSGVPILDVMHHHLVAWKGAVSWKKDTEELEHLKRLRDTGYTQGNKADIDRRILRLEDALDRNPVKELVEAGLMPTIVEDIDPEDDIYSYKSHLVRKVEGYTDKLNPTLVKAARTAYLAHDTAIYQGMSQMTRLSDFMARYTMYQHLISKKEPLSKQEATQKVSEAFINYDIALHRSIQYTDDMGITMFTKYFIGIQKVLMDTVRENPARVLTGVLLSKFLGLGPTVLDGSMWNHIGNNPLRSGPFELLDALGNLPMVNAPLALFNMGGASAP